ncbi:MAG: TIGR00730 family Rossman fold protein [Candidatus Ornithospirochaeta sp.]
MKKLNTLAVFCGSTMGEKPQYKEKAMELGREMARRGITLVYGGGNRGTMGVVSHAVHDNGGKVIGVLPSAMVIPSVTDNDVSDTKIVEDGMHSRKKKMYSLSDGFVALPGGIGTMEEILEIFTWKQLGYTGGNVALLNAEGYWDDLLAMLDKAVAEGFLDKRVRASLIVDDDPSRLIRRLEEEECELPDKLK